MSSDSGIEPIPALKAKIDFGYSRPKFTFPFNDPQLSSEYNSTSLKELVKPHLDSYNYMMTDGLKEIVKRLAPVEFELPNDCGRMEISVLDIVVHKPTYSSVDGDAGRPMYPNECRLSKTTYKGRIELKFCIKLQDEVIIMYHRSIGHCPVMVQSQLCNLYQAPDRVLVEKGEELCEAGGYFIVNGGERIVRLLLGQRRNYPSFIIRPNWQKLGSGYTHYGLTIRCIGKTQLPSDNFLHYIEDGTCTLSVFLDGNRYVVESLLHNENL
ncbi:hypothetical protein ACOME3_007590 [Neoechinorhynchus agilis]